MKRLYRSRKDKILAGVCGGIGEYFGIDPVFVRIIAVVLFFWGGTGILAYIIGMIIIPVDPGTEEATAKKLAKPAVVKDKKETPPPRSGDSGALIIGLILIVVGGIFLMRNLPIFDNFYWWIRHQIGHLFWPLVLIFIGSFIIFKGTKKN